MPTTTLDLPTAVEHRFAIGDKVKVHYASSERDIVHTIADVFVENGVAKYRYTNGGKDRVAFVDANGKPDLPQRTITYAIEIKVTCDGEGQPYSADITVPDWARTLSKKLLDGSDISGRSKPTQADWTVTIRDDQAPRSSKNGSVTRR